MFPAWRNPKVSDCWFAGIYLETIHGSLREIESTTIRSIRPPVEDEIVCDRDDGVFWERMLSCGRRMLRFDGMGHGFYTLGVSFAA